MATSSAASRIQANLQELFTANLAPGGAYYIRFQLTSEMTALLSMERVQESLVVEAERITPLPSMPSSVIGMMSSRDRVFCVFDLAQLLGLPSLSAYSRQYHTIIIGVSQFLDQQSVSEQELLVGMVVHRVQGITRVMSDQMRSRTGAAHSPQENSFPSLTPYLQGWVMDKEQQLPVLDLATIVKQAL